MRDATTLKRQYGNELINNDDVQAVGIGQDDDGEEALIITVFPGKADTLTIPDGLEDEEVVIEEREEFVTEVAPQVVKPEVDREGRVRPVVSGVSTGHPDVTAGTVGFNVTDGNTVYTGSNNHVYANVNQGSAGDPIYQPGTADGGGPDDQSATLADYHTVEDGALIDFAWATREVEFTNELAEVGAPQGSPRRVEVGDVLIKSGRTTGVTEGEVEQVNVSVDVNFGDAGVITMEDQIITEDMSDGGDSGSAVLHKNDNAPAGVLFAGSDSATVHNQAVNVEDVTGLKIVTDGGNGGGGGEMPTATVELRMTPTSPDTGNVEGTVVDDSDGSAVSGATITLQSDSNSVEVSSDSNGAFSVTDVAITEWQVTATKDGYEDASTTITADDFQ